MSHKTAEEIWDELTIIDSFVHPEILKTNLGKRILQAMEAYLQSRNISDEEIEELFASPNSAFLLLGTPQPPSFRNLKIEAAKLVRDKIFKTQE